MRLPKLRDKLTKEFNLYIRLRDSGPDGYGACISCGAHTHYTEGDCGHFVPSTHLSTRFNEYNCNLQCKMCNQFKDGNESNYAKGLQVKYGIQILDQLTLIKNTPVKITRIEYQELIQYYAKLNQLLLKLKKAGEQTPAFLFEISLTPFIDF